MRTSFFLTCIIGLSSTVAHAAVVEKVCETSVSWSDPDAWINGSVPGQDDVGAEQGPYANSCAKTQEIIVDTSDTLGSWITGESYDAVQNASNVSITLAQDATFAGDLHLREGTLSDAGHNLQVDGTLGNCGSSTCAYLDGEGNGMAFNRQGGVFHLAHVYLMRATTVSFRPGDIAGDFELACLSERSACPEAAVVQDTDYYVDNAGLSVEGTLTLGTLSSAVSVLSLSWDTGPVSGDIDWTLRVFGDQVATLQAAYAAGQIEIGTLPDGQSFDPNANIFYNADDGFTYIGFLGEGGGDEGGGEGGEGGEEGEDTATDTADTGAVDTGGKTAPIIGCSTAGGSTALGGVLLAGLALVARRRGARNV